MEDILDLYAREYDMLEPVICLDEKSLQLLKEVKEPLPPKPGKPKRYDYNYERNGTANIFMMFEPLAGIRHVKIRKTKTSKDFVEILDLMVNQYYSYARKIHLVMDNYSTHKLKNLYDYFPPEKAKDIADKICVHYTPTHASWLNAVEPEFSVMERQCLNERIGTVDQLRSISKNWEKIRNREVKGVDWQFTTDDARIKLKSLYPTLLV